MIIKKFEGLTEKEAMNKAKDELGPEAIVTNVKKITPRGLKGLFKKPTFEITVALDETPPKSELSRKESMRALFKNSPDIICDDENEEPQKKNAPADTAALEVKLSDLTSLLEKKMNEQTAPSPSEPKNKPLEDTEADSNVSYIRLVYNQLAENEVDEKYINQIISEIEPVLKKDAPVESIISAIYQKIILKLGRTEVLDIKPGKTRYVFFIGPTGVGKTTTIAKLASKLKLEKKRKVALLTSDTYRIAAVEQLHTYANIIQIPMTVVDTPVELADARENYKGYDVVFIDTAGRSHRNKEQKDDLEQLIGAVPKEEREIFLVLSATTKYRDLIAITEAYSEISDYRLIFTKLDETAYLGNIYNIRQLTGAPLSYATFGQNVPDDISRIDAQTIAKQLLGGVE